MERPTHGQLTVDQAKSRLIESGRCAQLEAEQWMSRHVVGLAAASFMLGIELGSTSRKTRFNAWPMAQHAASLLLRTL